MTCEEMRPLVSALQDGELGGEDEALVRAHLAACAACRALAEELARTSQLVAKHAPRPRMDELAWARFEDALAKEPLSFARRSGPWWGGLSGLLGAAALVGLTWGLSLVLVVSQAAVSLFALPSRQLKEIPFTDPAPVAGKIPPCPRGLEGVANAEAASALTEGQRKALERDGLVQAPGSATSLDGFYGQGNALVTADAALLVYGGAVSRAVLEAEREDLAPGLRATLEPLERELASYEERAESAAVARSARLAHRIVLVACALDGVGPGATDPDVLADAAKARSARGRERSLVLGRDVDWGRFEPRGALAALPAHFATVVWLGEASLRLDAQHPDELRAASLMTLGIARSMPVLARWVALDDAATLVHGPQDDLGALDVLMVVRSALGDSVRPDLLGHDEAVARIAQRASEAAKPRSTGSVATVEPDALVPRFRLLGATRSLEELVLSDLSGERLPGRARPTSLDLLAALGSSPARAVASSDGTPGYGRALDALGPLLEDVTSVPRAVSRSGSGVERSRLFALAKLVERPSPTAPAFMATQAYSDRLLLAALAGLDEVEPAPEDGELVQDPSAPLPLVEPLPGFYARLAHGARRLALGLEATTPGATRATARLRRTSELLTGLSLAAEETLEARPFSTESRRALASFASAARVLAPASALSVDDVHVLARQDGTREWLERMCGPLDRLFLVLPGEDGKLRLASGPALSAREVTASAPLTRDDVARAARQDPAWASHVVR